MELREFIHVMTFGQAPPWCLQRKDGYLHNGLLRNEKIKTFQAIARNVIFCVMQDIDFNLFARLVLPRLNAAHHGIETV